MSPVAPAPQRRLYRAWKSRVITLGVGEDDGHESGTPVGDLDGEVVAPLELVHANRLPLSRRRISSAAEARCHGKAQGKKNRQPEQRQSTSCHLAGQLLSCRLGSAEPKEGMGSPRHCYLQRRLRIEVADRVLALVCDPPSYCYSQPEEDRAASESHCASSDLHRVARFRSPPATSASSGLAHTHPASGWMGSGCQRYLHAALLDGSVVL